MPYYHPLHRYEHFTVRIRLWMKILQYVNFIIESFVLDKTKQKYPQILTYCTKCV